jgi:flagellar protein FliL
MLKMILPVLLALGGLGAGVGAGLALKPEHVAAADACTGGDAAPGAAVPADAAEAGAGGEEAAPADCAAAAEVDAAHAGGFDTVSLDKPFVVPLFERESVTGMVVLSLSVEVAHGKGGAVETLQPRLRDKFLAAMFRHANSGGFDGSFTEGQKMADLKAALRAAAREVMPEAGIGEVLVTEIVRQDV